MQVVGRDTELARVDKWLDAARAGPVRILIEGEAGIGKTTLWRSAVDAAVRLGFRALIARPSEGDSSLAYAGLADLLTNVEREFFASLPEPQRQALDVALLEAAPKGRTAGPASYLHSIPVDPRSPRRAGATTGGC